MQLTPGDTVVFYTDGIVEAMNQREEVFGFQRLLQVVENSRSKTGEALLKEIVDRAREFAKGASQHDDQTVIVVRVTG
jgi:sigma-B regulation protein RsbU (phosphoserine phosphatase)